MTDKDKEATDKLNKWMADIGLANDCKDYCEIGETEETEEMTELIKEQHDHD